MYLANLAGLWALAAIPAILAIHMLRRKSRPVITSTLFLVERTLPTSEGGRRIKRLTNSLPLWLQLLAALVFTIMLACPRWIRPETTQTVVVVMDNSASMSAFRTQAIALATRELPAYESIAAKTRWIFLNSNNTRLASAYSLPEALRSLESWQPSLPNHDVSETLRLARDLAGTGGAVVYLTDHPPETEPANIRWLSAGESLGNAGFSGVQADADNWTVLLRNYDTQPRDIGWRVVAGETPGPWQSVSVDGGAMHALKGKFDTGDRLTLEVSPDAFVLDDRMPLVKPRPKRLSVSAADDEKYRKLFAQILEAMPEVEPATTPSPDLRFVLYDPMVPAPAQNPGIIFVKDPSTTAKPIGGMIVTENHPLMENLNWQGLIARQNFKVPFRENDQGLLWQGEQALIFLRPLKEGSQLVFNFDIIQSNATRLPAFAVLLSRYIESQRIRKEAFETKNVETGQKFPLTGAGDIQAPVTPQFFEVSGKSGAPLLLAAAHFSDPVEADLQSSAPYVSGPGQLEALRERNSTGEFLDPLWAALVMALMIANWVVTGARIQKNAGNLRESQAPSNVFITPHG